MGFRRLDVEPEEWYDESDILAGDTSDSESDEDVKGESSDEDPLSPKAEAMVKSLTAQLAPLLGTWRLDRCEGDMGQLLDDANVDWMTKRSAKTFNYGVGLVSHTIEQHSGRKLTILMKGGLKTLKTELDLTGQEERECQGEDGADI